MPKEIMANLSYTGEGLKFIGNTRSYETLIDATKVGDGDEELGPSPMELMLQTAAACSGMDVVSILKKKRKTVEDLQIEISGTKRDEHPKIYTNVHMKFVLKSPDAEDKDLQRSIELSHDKYCAATATLKLAGAEVSWDYEIVN